MSDYSWIKNGVRAVIINPGDPYRDPQGRIGQVVTIRGEIFEDRFGDQCVHFEETDFKDDEYLMCIALRPYKDDQDKLYDWEEIAKKNAKPCVDWKPERVSA